MSAEFSRIDRYGREIASAPHLSNCWLYAVEVLHQHGGHVRLCWNGLVPHLLVESPDGVREFVYGEYGRNRLFPVLFKGYGVKAPSDQLTFVHRRLTMNLSNVPRSLLVALAIVVILVVLMLLSGCAGTVPADPSKLSAEQLEALAKDRGASAACTVANTPWGVGRTIYVQLDRGVIPIGSVSVDQECKVTVTTAVPPPRAASAP